MARLALARKYRPQTISELIGQPALKATLSKAIPAGRVAQAYLLHGPRGTGKTSTARIVAKALNCINGPTAEPCGVCDQCQAISADRHLDVMEVDAASNSGVEDMRSYIDSTEFAPVQGKYKVFIIDECHMLSKNAWNALLKTLEEPPAHMIFILCTTELNKVLATIISRCQRFQLQLVTDDELKVHFRDIVTKEGAAATDEALDFVVAAAEGSVRDGLSILDQLISRYPEGATGEDARNQLGLPDERRIRDIVGYILDGKGPAAVGTWRGLIAGGADPAYSLKEMMKRLHLLTVLAAAPEAAKAIGLPEADQAIARKHPIAKMTAIWQQLVKSHADMQDAPNRVHAGDMTIIRLAS